MVSSFRPKPVSPPPLAQRFTQAFQKATRSRAQQAQQDEQDEQDRQAQIRSQQEDQREALLLQKFNSGQVNLGEFSELKRDEFQEKYGDKASDALEFAFYKYKVASGKNLSSDEQRNFAIAGQIIGRDIRKQLGGGLQIVEFRARPKTPEVIQGSVGAIIPEESPLFVQGEPVTGGYSSVSGASVFTTSSGKSFTQYPASFERPQASFEGGRFSPAVPQGTLSTKFVEGDFEAARFTPFVSPKKEVVVSKEIPSVLAERRLISSLGIYALPYRTFRAINEVPGNVFKAATELQEAPFIVGQSTFEGIATTGRGAGTFVSESFVGKGYTPIISQEEFERQRVRAGLAGGAAFSILPYFAGGFVSTAQTAVDLTFSYGRSPEEFVKYVGIGIASGALLKGLSKVNKLNQVLLGSGVVGKTYKVASKGAAVGAAAYLTIPYIASEGGQLYESFSKGNSSAFRGKILDIKAVEAPIVLGTRIGTFSLPVKKVEFRLDSQRKQIVGTPGSGRGVIGAKATGRVYFDKTPDFLKQEFAQNSRLRPFKKLFVSSQPAEVYSEFQVRTVSQQVGARGDIDPILGRLRGKVSRKVSPVKTTEVPEVLSGGERARAEADIQKGLLKSQLTETTFEVKQVGVVKLKLTGEEIPFGVQTIQETEIIRGLQQGKNVPLFQEQIGTVTLKGPAVDKEFLGLRKGILVSEGSGGKAKILFKGKTKIGRDILKQAKNIYVENLETSGRFSQLNSSKVTSLEGKRQGLEILKAKNVGFTSPTDESSKLIVREKIVTVGKKGTPVEMASKRNLLERQRQEAIFEKQGVYDVQKNPILQKRTLRELGDESISFKYADIPPVEGQVTKYSLRKPIEPVVGSNISIREVSSSTVKSPTLLMDKRFSLKPLGVIETNLGIYPKGTTVSSVLNIGTESVPVREISRITGLTPSQVVKTVGKTKLDVLVGKNTAAKAGFLSGRQPEELAAGITEPTIAIRRFQGVYGTESILSHEVTHAADFGAGLLGKIDKSIAYEARPQEIRAFAVQEKFIESRGRIPYKEIPFLGSLSFQLNKFQYATTADRTTPINAPTISNTSRGVIDRGVSFAYKTVTQQDNRSNNLFPVSSVIQRSTQIQRPLFVPSTVLPSSAVRQLINTQSFKSSFFLLLPTRPIERVVPRLVQKQPLLLRPTTIPIQRPVVVPVQTPLQTPRQTPQTIPQTVPIVTPITTPIVEPVTTPVNLPPTLPFLPPPSRPPSGFFPTGGPADQRKQGPLFGQAFKLITKRRGKEIELPELYTYQDALAAGTNLVANSLAASFKYKAVGGFAKPRGIRAADVDLYQNKSGFFVQKLGTRLATFGERSEIKQAKINIAKSKVNPFGSQFSSPKKVNFGKVTNNKSGRFYAL